MDYRVTVVLSDTERAWLRVKAAADNTTMRALIAEYSRALSGDAEAADRVKDRIASADRRLSAEIRAKSDQKQ